MNQKLILKYTASIATSLLTAFVGWVAISTSYSPWFTGLEKSTFHPAEWLAIAVWIILFIIMGIAAGKVWSKGFYHKWVQVALYHFGFQLILTGFWFLTFFGLQQPLLAFFVVLALLVLLSLTIKWFKIVDDTAAYLMYPSVVWALYMALLNFELWRLN
ncbi:TspO/MBR family protein [Salinimicrobium sp. GXAS 041]|uniref:TspO/MBR family protein n=1 Tax=Salinimicrobium sp. GXAS 041 TaxID=3400806 RepID=UPI003C74CF53